MVDEVRKSLGAYYTPAPVAESLVRWAVRAPTDRMLDPACGDGRFLAAHEHSVGVEQDPTALSIAAQRVPHAVIHESNFFAWAEETDARFDCAAGNPPFIRYQRFTGEVRGRALRLCARLGAGFSSLTSSWAPFLVATSSLLRPGGRLAVVVPAEIGHAPYAAPLLRYLKRHFARVQVIAIRNKVFADLSEDCWLLFASGFGGSTNTIKLTALDGFRGTKTPPGNGVLIRANEWEKWTLRLRPFLLPDTCRSLYEQFADDPSSVRFGEVARIGIGYVTGANSFFHLRPSEARRFGIPECCLQPTIRSGKNLTTNVITHSTVKKWINRDDPMLLLRLRKEQRIPRSVNEYLNSEAAEEARQAYKCRNRTPWYVVPDVAVPSGFLSYMSGNGVSLVANHADCSCTNSVHAVHLNGRIGMAELRRRWSDPVTALSCEIEGHPLGGGMLKVEPGEALRILLVDREPSPTDDVTIQDGVGEMKRWRHYG